MEVQFTPEQALALWATRERHRVEMMAALDEAEANLLSGDFDDYTDDTLPLLAEELKAEARALRDRSLCK